jgi:hypothetical protein
MSISITIGDRKQLDNDWELHVDNDFASGLFSTIKSSDSLEVPQVYESYNPCKECQIVREDLWSPAFSITYDVSKLEARSKSKECDLCGLFWRTCERRGGTTFSTVKFDRIQSSLKMNGGGPPVLSIFRSPGVSTQIVVRGAAMMNLY